MTPIGVIGGIGPESTIEYYRLFVAEHRRLTQDDSYPAVIINSVNLTKLVRCFEANALGEAADYLAVEIGRLESAGAGVGLLAANTPHLVFDDLRRRVRLPLISIVEAVCAHARAAGLKRLGLFGTRFTMTARFYPDVFSREGLAIVVPSPEEQAYIHEKYMGELVKGTFLPATRDGLLRIARALRAREGIDGLILGGTELPLILREASDEGLPLLDTGKIHVQHALRQVSC